MHKLSSAFVLGYHGCDSTVAEKLLGGAPFKPSQNNYDWLGNGIYFWEANPRRGLEFAQEIKARRPGAQIKLPVVIGAIIELGLCLDLTTSAGIQQVTTAHQKLSEIAKKAEQKLPENSLDQMRRSLDCAVIQFLHTVRNDAQEPAIDSVRGVFLEGAPIFEGSGFYQKTHIQICVCNPKCIKGVFRVAPDQIQ